MKSKSAATNLLRQYILFALTILLLLTLARAAYGLWQFSTLAKTESFLDLFVQGLRFDLALIGIICFVPIVGGTLMATGVRSRAWAKVLIILFLVGGLVLVLVLEMMTPWFLDTYGLRPDLQLLTHIEQPLGVLKAVLKRHVIPILVALLLFVLVMASFWSRLEVGRFLKAQVSVPGALTVALFGGLLCIIAVRSSAHFSAPALSPSDAIISQDYTVNELAMNSTYKVLYSFFQPMQRRVAQGGFLQERLRLERLRQEQWKQERVQQERLQQEPLQPARVQEERLPSENLQQERLYLERLDRERLQLQQERLQQERLYQERLQRERLYEEALRKELPVERTHLQEEPQQRESIEREHLYQQLYEEQRRREQLRLERLRQESLW